MSDETRWFDDRDEMERCNRRRVTLWLAVMIGIALAVGVVVAHAEPLFRVSAEGSTVVLHSEDCKLDVKNLRKRATWTENGVVTEGCYGGHPQWPIVLFYFADKTVVVIPMELFQRVSGT